MDQKQLSQARVTVGVELEYLINDQWIPATFEDSTRKVFVPTGSISQNITIRLLSHPSNEPGTIHLTDDDIKHRLRVKGSNRGSAT
jgi:hypothetical protein